MPGPQINHPALWRSDLPRPQASAHKYQRGHAAILAAPALTGATRLAAAACSRIGAGLVTVLACEKPDVFRATLPPDIMVSEGEITSLKRLSALLAGSGGLESAYIDEMTTHRGPDSPMILDADAILKRSLFRQMSNSPMILTPHDGEFAKAFPERTHADRIQAASEVASHEQAYLVLKGPETVIAAPDGSCVVNRHASPYLAKAGTGDVLAGMICGLVAQGMELFQACCAAVWVHGEAGRRIGPGLIAQDIIEALPEILRVLLDDTDADQTHL